MGDLNRFHERYIALRSALIADGQSAGVPFHVNDLSVLSERIRHEGSSFALIAIPTLGKAFDQCLVTGRFTAPSNFRLKGKTRLPILFYTVFRTVIDDEGNLLPSPQIDSIRYLRQILLYDSKLLTGVSKEQEEKAIAGFINRQSNLRKIKLPIGHPVIEDAKRILTRVLKYLDLTNIVPGHGPGIVAEGYDRFRRWEFDEWSAKAERHYPYLAYGTPSLRASLERGVGIKLRKKLVTKCCLVPKDFKGPRLISAESVLTQYLQQGQMKAIMHYIDRHPVLSRSIKLRDQTHNQRMCQTAYHEGKATLDLSNASDTVSCVLVWYLLSGVPKLRRQLMSTRSDFLSHKGQEVKIVAFAPMGSAVCFPVETLVFWALSLASLRLVKPQYCGKRPSFKREVCAIPDKVLASEIAVFGDDIVIPEEALSILIATLEAVGCEPNYSKTCFQTPFRESCGSEWYNHTDVSIIRNRRYNYDATRSRFSDILVLADLQRKHFLKGQWRTSDILKQWVCNIYPVPELSLQHLTGQHGQNPFGNATEMDAYTRGGVRRRDQRIEELYAPPESEVFTTELFSEAAWNPRVEGSYRNMVTGLSFFARNNLHADAYCCTLGLYDSISNRLPVRYNRCYQRKEYRIPTSFQPSKDWTQGGYARLLARLTDDSVERIALRDLRIRMAWSYLPLT